MGWVESGTNKAVEPQPICKWGSETNKAITIEKWLSSGDVIHSFDVNSHYCYRNLRVHCGSQTTYFRMVWVLLNLFLKQKQSHLPWLLCSFFFALIYWFRFKQFAYAPSTLSALLCVSVLLPVLFQRGTKDGSLQPFMMRQGIVSSFLAIFHRSDSVRLCMRWRDHNER